MGLIALNTGEFRPLTNTNIQEKTMMQSFTHGHFTRQTT